MRKTTKVCRKCGEEKESLTNFYKSTGRTDNWCTTCRKNYVSSRYKEERQSPIGNDRNNYKDDDLKRLLDFPEFRYEPKNTIVKPKQELIQDGYYFKWSS